MGGHHPLPEAVHIVRSSQDTINGSLAGVRMGSWLSQSSTFTEMMSDWTSASTTSPTGVCLCVHSCGACGRQTESCSIVSSEAETDLGAPQPRASNACEGLLPSECTWEGVSTAGATYAKEAGRSQGSPAAASAMQACSVIVPGLKWRRFISTLAAIVESTSESTPAGVAMLTTDPSLAAVLMGLAKVT